MKEDNGIIVVEDENKSKHKYQILNCFSITSTNKEYLSYSNGKEDEDTILIYVSEIKINENNTIELLDVKSESTLVEIGVLLKQIYDQNVDDSKYQLNSININNKFKVFGHKSIKLEPDYYKKIKKDYNTNKKKREIIGEQIFLKELTIEKVRKPDKDFINQFKIDKKYINAIRNI